MQALRVFQSSLRRASSTRLDDPEGDEPGCDCPLHHRFCRRPLPSGRRAVRRGSGTRSLERRLQRGADPLRAGTPSCDRPGPGTARCCRSSSRRPSIRSLPASTPAPRFAPRSQANEGEAAARLERLTATGFAGSPRARTTSLQPPSSLIVAVLLRDIPSAEIVYDWFGRYQSASRSDRTSRRLVGTRRSPPGVSGSGVGA